MASGSCNNCCNKGYSPAGSSTTATCSVGGTFTPATCKPDTCNAAAAVPTNGAKGTCTATLASGSSCQPSCNPGFERVGTHTCKAGVLTSLAVCDTTACCSEVQKCFSNCTIDAKWQGGNGNCGSTLASGSSCTHACPAGTDR